MNWLLDTNIVSEFTKPKPDPACEAWLEAHSEKCALCTISLSELRFGIERMPEGKKKSERDREFKHLAEDYSGRFFEFDAPSAFEWGRYAAELEAEYGSDWWKQFDLRDTQIAAIAREYGLTIATRNTRDFPFCKTENPFQYRQF
jgi:predicted nucleic acid-binding protein